MDVITDKIKNLEEFLDNLDLFIKSEINENEAIIIDMNIQDQLYEKGINRLGEKISDYRPYRPSTISIKKEKGQPTARVTLKDEGDFYRSFYVEARSDSFYIYAKDEKTNDLERKYGKEVFGLTDDNLNELIWSYIYPRLLTELKKV